MRLDRALVEILLTASILCVMAFAVASASAQYSCLASVMIDASSGEMHYSAVRAIMDAASEAKAAGSPASVVLLLPSKIAIGASGGNISTTCLGVARSYICCLDASGAGFSDSFNITGMPDGTVTVTPLGH